jgi:hypothetical protein
MRLRIAEIDQHAVAHEPGDIPVISAHRGGDALMVRCDHFLQVFRIEPRGQWGGADNIAEHDRELSALGAVSAGQRGHSGQLFNSRFPHRPAAAAAEPRAGLVLETAGRARRGQRHAALGAESPRRRVFRHAARAAHWCDPLWVRGSSRVDHNGRAMALEAEARIHRLRHLPHKLASVLPDAGKAGILHSRSAPSGTPGRIVVGDRGALEQPA